MNNKIINCLLITSNIALIILLLFLTFGNKDLTPDKIYKNNIQSVVEVKAETEGIGESFGTAVIINKNGYAITNAHVISYDLAGETTVFNEIFIRFAKDNNYISAEILKIDYSLDLAILEISSSVTVKPISFSKREYKTGDKIYAIGNSSNYGVGISEGIISVREVNIVYDEEKRTVIQCDISILSGNSGGALVDKNGNLIGITTFRTKDSSGKINYGFVYAIPLKTIENFIGGE